VAHETNETKQPAIPSVRATRVLRFDSTRTRRRWQHTKQKSPVREIRLPHSLNKLHLAPDFTEIQMPTQPMEDPMDLRLDTHRRRFIYCDEPSDTMNDYTSDTMATPMPRGQRMYRDARSAHLRGSLSGNDDICGDAADPRDHIVPPELRSRVAAANGDIAATEAPASEWLASHELYQAARTRRGDVLRTLVLAAVQSLREFARNALPRYRRRRQMRAIYDTLQGLDDFTLRDLGFHRSEIMSVAAEAVEEAERTRVRVLRMPRAPRW
jgi:uncharacterized protein YjiS (DUF1127 family)